MKTKKPTAMYIFLVTTLLAIFVIIYLLKNCNQIGDPCRELIFNDSLEKRGSSFFSTHTLNYESLTEAISYSIDPRPLVVKNKLAEHMIEDSPLYFKINNTPLTPLLAAEISTVALDNFNKNIASTLTCTCSKDKTTALRILYGVDASHKLVLYYQPLVLCMTGTTQAGSSSATQGNYNICNTGTIYTYSAGSTQFSVATSLMELTEYRRATTGVWILKVPGSGNFVEFEDKADTDITGDTESIIFSFDQIMKMCETTANIRFWNSAYKEESVYPYIIKHSLLISTDNVTYTGTDLNIPFTAYFSDLAHICPIRCDVLTFTLKP